MRRYVAPIILALCFLVVPLQAAGDLQARCRVGLYRPAWESLRAPSDPEWFRDAKFGIYTHWGPVTLGTEDCPCGGQWYGHEMYNSKSGVFACHQKHFGDQAKGWLQGPLSDVQGRKVRRRSMGRPVRPLGCEVRRPGGRTSRQLRHVGLRGHALERGQDGPHRDVVGELEKAIRRHGLKFLTTFHHGYAWRYYESAFAFDGALPQYAPLYTEAHKPAAPPSRSSSNDGWRWSTRLWANTGPT